MLLNNKKIEKELSVKFKNVLQPSYKIKEENVCLECQERHSKLDQGRQITLDDIALSCYSNVFYEPPVFEFLMPLLLIKAMNKESDSHGGFPEYFLQRIRCEEQAAWFQDFSSEKKTVIIKALEFIGELYYMENYNVWDFEEEKMIHFSKEECLNKESKLSLVYWTGLLNT